MSSCPSIAVLSSTNLFTNACLITSVSTSVPVLSALTTCCGSDNVNTTPDDCYTYCNITVLSDIKSWASCLSDNLDATTIDELDLGCAADFITDVETESAAIATTWPAQQIVETVLSSGSVIATTTDSGAETATTMTAVQVTVSTVAASSSDVACSSYTGPGCTVSPIPTGSSGLLNELNSTHVTGSGAERGVSRALGVLVLFVCLGALL
jgi:hypothetical protein